MSSRSGNCHYSWPACNSILTQNIYQSTSGLWVTWRGKSPIRRVLIQKGSWRAWWNSVPIQQDNYIFWMIKGSLDRCSAISLRNFISSNGLISWLLLKYAWKIHWRLRNNHCNFHQNGFMRKQFFFYVIIVAVRPLTLTLTVFLYLDKHNKMINTFCEFFGLQCLVFSRLGRIEVGY